MLISFEEYPIEQRWEKCIQKLRDEYTLSFKDICKILKCGRPWVVRYLKPYLHYIYLSNGNGDNGDYVQVASKHLGKKIKDSTWYSIKEFQEIISSNISKAYKSL